LFGGFFSNNSTALLASGSALVSSGEFGSDCGFGSGSASFSNSIIDG